MRGWCWHNWTKWMDSKAVFRLSPRFGGGTAVIDMQYRRCRKCNKREERES